MAERKWDILIAVRIYSILLFIVMPVAHVAITLKYVQPTGWLIFGFAAWLLFKFVVMETRTGSKRFLNISLAFLVPASIMIFLNFLAGMFIDLVHDNHYGFIFSLGLTAGACYYFPVMILIRPFKGLNARVAAMSKSSSLVKRSPEIALALWAIVAVAVLVLPYRTYLQPALAKEARSKPARLGFWTNTRFFDERTAGPGRYVSDEMLEKFGQANVYLVYSGVRKEKTDGHMLEDLTRCRDHGVKVNLSFSSNVEGYNFVNLWTFESMKGTIDEVLTFLDHNGMLGDPVTTVVYDMEAPTGKFFPLYGRDARVIEGLRDYYRVQNEFRDFNRHLREDYGLEVRICAETNQAFDPTDGDDDLIALYGVLSDEKALMSYMIYRRGNYVENYVVDSARYLQTTDTIILNSWKFEGYQCWQDVDCAIKDARLTIGYPGKNLNVEIWALCYFLDSHGKDGLFAFVDGVTGDSYWPEIEVRNKWPHSALWDLAITGISTLDLYGPIFRVVFHAY